MPIAVPSCDASFDPQCSGTAAIDFFRSLRSPSGDLVNLNTAFLDASFLYGSSASRLAILRTGATGRGRLAVAKGIDGDTPPFTSDPSLVSGTNVFLSGDPRNTITSNVGAVVTLFLRQHNKFADRISAAHPAYSDRLVFELARAVTRTLWGSLIYRYYIPSLIGKRLPAYSGYKPAVNPSIDICFSTSAFRYGHSAVVPLTPRLLAVNGPTAREGPLYFKDSFFSSQPLQKWGIETLLLGMASSPEATTDARIIEDLMKLFNKIDLPAFNIQRGRDHGLPSYTQARRAAGLPSPASFEALVNVTGIESEDVLLLQELYGSVGVEEIDMYPAGLAEPAVPGGILGPLFAAIVTDQFIRIRDGDRFYDLTNRSAAFPDAASAKGDFKTYIDALTTDDESPVVRSLIAAAKVATFAEVVLNNTAIEKYPANPLGTAAAADLSVPRGSAENSITSQVILIQDLNYIVKWSFPQTGVIEFTLSGPKGTERGCF